MVTQSESLVSKLQFAGAVVAAVLATGWGISTVVPMADSDSDNSAVGASESHETDDNNHGGHGHDHSGHAHGGHGHEHGGSHGHSGEQLESSEVMLSDEATWNAGVTPEYLREIRFQEFSRAVVVPAQIVDRAGRTQLHVATPMTGMVTHVHATEGESVVPGTLLFRIRLTHEDLLKLQTDFLQTIGELDVEQQEIRRLTKATNDQAVAGELLLDREYQRDKLRALREAQVESLRMHGLSASQIDSIADTRRLVQELSVFAPRPEDHSHSADLSRTDGDQQPQQPLVLHQLNVSKGQLVAAGTSLCILKDYSELLIEGQVLARDRGLVQRLVDSGQLLTAVTRQSGQPNRLIDELTIDHLANISDQDSQVIRIFLRLKNHPVREVSGSERFMSWRWLPGQQLDLRLPVKSWRKQIVLPVEAVTRQGADSYVFRHHMDHFERVRIHERYRDQHFVVAERDGALSQGNQIAWRGAQQLLLALRQQSASPVNSHGHSHPH